MARHRYHGGLHGQRMHRYKNRKMRSRARKARRASKRAYYKMIRKPKRAVVKAYANTVGQIVFKSGRSRPSHRRKVYY